MEARGRWTTGVVCLAAAGVNRSRADQHGEDALVADAIRRIKEAEGEAEEAQRRARAQGKRLMAEAHEASEKLFEQMRRGVRDEEGALTAAARADAEKQAAAIAAESRASIEAVRGGAETSVRQGVVRVLEAIVSGT